MCFSTVSCVHKSQRAGSFHWWLKFVFLEILRITNQLAFQHFPTTAINEEHHFPDSASWGTSSSPRVHFWQDFWHIWLRQNSLWFVFPSFHLVHKPARLKLILLSRERENTMDWQLQRGERHHLSVVIFFFSTFTFFWQSSVPFVFPEQEPGSSSHKGRLVWVFLTGQIEVSLLPLLAGGGGNRRTGGGTGAGIQQRKRRTCNVIMSTGMQEVIMQYWISLLQSCTLKWGSVFQKITFFTFPSVRWDY